MARINASGIREMLARGLTTAQVADIKLISKSSVIRLAKAGGYLFTRSRLHREDAWDQMEAGATNEQVADEQGCSVSTARRWRREKYGKTRFARQTEPLFNYKEWLEEKLRAHHREFSKMIPWPYEKFRAWVRTAPGQVYLLLAMDEPDDAGWRQVDRGEASAYATQNDRGIQ